MNTMPLMIPKMPRIIAMLVDIPVAAFLLCCIVLLKILAMAQSASQITSLFHRNKQK